MVETFLRLAGPGNNVKFASGHMCADIFSMVLARSPPSYYICRDEIRIWITSARAVVQSVWKIPEAQA